MRLLRIKSTLPSASGKRSASAHTRAKPRTQASLAVSADGKHWVLLNATPDLRAQLLAQLNSVLQTVDTPRGLVVTMADILFASGKYQLSQDANLKLARLSGVILAHPGLKLRIEGYTDTTGTEDFNLKLSGQRAETVQSFLVGQGLKADDVTSAGMGQADPVAGNDTAAGRQKNRRVEIIVSGEAIGTKIG